MTSSSNTTANDYVECPLCGGEGQIEVEVAVVDHMNGGYLKEEMMTCELCDGNGEVLQDDADEFTIFVELEDGPFLH
ncbi:MAG: hypothetical protein VW739_04325 [Pelagibacteraceae bacterium]